MATRQPERAAESQGVKKSTGLFPKRAGYALLTLLALLLLLRVFVLIPVRVVSSSMLPELATGDILLVSKIRHGLGLIGLKGQAIHSFLPARGDIALFRFPGRGKTLFIKRIVGLPGDRILLRGQSLVINGREIESVPTGNRHEVTIGGRNYQLWENEEHLPGTSHPILLDPEPGRTMPPPVYALTVPAQHYFVLGDNRNHSFDSRNWGTVPQQDIIGRAFFVLFSWDNKLRTINWRRSGPVR